MNYKTIFKSILNGFRIGITEDNKAELISYKGYEFSKSDSGGDEGGGGADTSTYTINKEITQFPVITDIQLSTSHDFNGQSDTELINLVQDILDNKINKIRKIYDIDSKQGHVKAYYDFYVLYAGFVASGTVYAIGLRFNDGTGYYSQQISIPIPVNGVVTGPITITNSTPDQ